MELNQLRYFLSVAKYENITRAAEKLHITQPSLSRAIANLEEELGASLFERNQRKLKLNKSGEILRNAVEKMFNELDDCIRAVRESVQMESSAFTIACSVMDIYSTISKQFFLDNDELILSQIACQAEDIPELLKSKKADLGICFDTFSDPELGSVVLTDMEIMLVTGPNSRHAGKRDIALEELRDDYFVCNEMGYNRQLTDALCMQAGFVPKKRYVSPDYETVGRVIHEYDVVSFIPSGGLSASRIRDELLPSLIRLDQGKHRERLRLYYIRGVPLHPSAERFISNLNEVLIEDC